MDDADDREYSRAPEVEDLAKLCEALNREGAKARKATLIRTKLTGRESDAVDVGFLRLRIEADEPGC